MFWLGFFLGLACLPTAIVLAAMLFTGPGEDGRNGTV